MTKPWQRLPLRVIVIAAALSRLAPLAQSRTFAFTSYFSSDDSSCGGIPQFIHIEDIDGCNFQACGEVAVAGDTNYSSVQCYSDDQEQTAALYEAVAAPYVLLEEFSPDYEVCGLLSDALAFYADGLCRPLPNITTYAGVIATVSADLSVQLQLYNDSGCIGTDAYFFDVPAENTSGLACYVEDVSKSFKFYANTPLNSASTSASTATSASASSSSTGSSGASGVATPTPTIDTSTGGNSSMSGGAIAGIVVGCLVAVALIVAIIFWRRKRAASSVSSPGPVLEGAMKGDYGQVSLLQDSNGKTTSSQRTPGPEAYNADGLWTDEVIVAARIPREKVVLEQRVSRGGFGEVYAGKFNGQRVAVKILLPETRKRIQSVNEFLAEVKLMASLEHLHIVTFIGVAWDSLTDLCVVSEFMEGGDLQALLNKYQADHHPLGFDFQKVKIALQMAHALTYMHSLAPPLVHRDLKSKNILLTSDLDAKLTDFGASRERVDRTMTAGVGTSLWMAPEMMTGEKYDEKADIFSFGVVLSELDSHALPYTNPKRTRHTSDLAVLQQVMQGKLQITFSEACPPALSELGMACASRDPEDRPAAAQVLYKLQLALAQFDQ
jgi:serine/threonine-protein kinase TNNI3K